MFWTSKLDLKHIFQGHSVTQNFAPACTHTSVVHLPKYTQLPAYMMQTFL